MLAPRIYVLHENNEWVLPLRRSFDALNLPYTEWFLDEGALDLSVPPPLGVFYNRMSASSHTRDHRFAPEYTSCVLAWLQAHRRPVFNGARALQLEINKVAQYQALADFGVRTPKTVATVGSKALLAAAENFPKPFITKHNRAGKGLGVHLFYSTAALREALDSGLLVPSVDGVMLLQEYIQAPEPFIMRLEFVGRKFLYAVRVDTSEGFQLCPADACQAGDAFCPANAMRAKFEIVPGYRSPLIEPYRRFMKANNIHIAAFEHIIDKQGVAYTYDVNTNTNYNSPAEAMYGGLGGMPAVARCLGRALMAYCSYENPADVAVVGGKA